MGRLRIPELSDRTASAPVADLEALARFVAGHERLLVITGAGCSTASGIPAYRDGEGRWTQRSPILYPDFLRSETVRRRYWARSYSGWPITARAAVNDAHRALAILERNDHVAHLVTQNVDGLHVEAGQQHLIELHGRLRDVICLDCGERSTRAGLQQRLAGLNPDWSPEILALKPDGDVDLDEQAYPGFRIADCERCGGVLKPDVVFFGESIPRERGAAVAAAVENCDAVLVVGTSLVVASAYRIVRDASTAGRPVAAINDGRTRADDLLAFKVGGRCDAVLPRLVAALRRRSRAR